MLAMLADEFEDDEPVTNIADLDDDAWDELWESGEEESSESVFDIDDGWGVEDLDSQLDGPPRMDRIGRFDKQLRNVSKARKLAIPLTGRVSPCFDNFLTGTLGRMHGVVQRTPGCIHDIPRLACATLATLAPCTPSNAAARHVSLCKSMHANLQKRQIPDQQPGQAR